MTSVDEKTVYPDLNVPGTQARAIRGEQEVLDKVTIPAGLSVEESEKLVSKMTAKHGIVHVNDTGDAAGKELLARKGDEALVDYAEASKYTKARMLVNQLKEHMARRGGATGAFSPESSLKGMSEFARIYQSEGEDAAMKYVVENPHFFERRDMNSDFAKEVQAEIARAKGLDQSPKALPGPGIELDIV